MSSYKPSVSAVTIKSAEHVKQLDELCRMAGLTRADALGRLFTVIFKHGIDKKLIEEFNNYDKQLAMVEDAHASRLAAIEPFPAVAVRKDRRHPLETAAAKAVTGPKKPKSPKKPKTAEAAPEPAPEAV